MDPNQTVRLVEGILSNATGAAGTLAFLHFYRTSGKHWIFLPLMSFFHALIALSLASIHNASAVIWIIASIYVLYIWWKGRPPRKRRFRVKAKALFRKIKAYAPRPLAPVPVGN